ncbi:hypothetical protein C8Q76DRAFT_708804 [Earliella scabrosa]|nr:hypothetical protein C8Q76DRAFT_708804 [Earliella scabrosa]
MGSSMTFTQETRLVEQTVGAIFLAAFFSTMLYGLMLHQAYRYIRLYTHDSTFIKSLVGIVL